MTPGIHPFDLQARAALATHGLTALLDPEREGLMYFLASWRHRPPRADHSLWDCGDGSGRHVDALTLARTMVRRGSAAASPAVEDGQIERRLLRFLGPDGLSWLPQEPWAAPWGTEYLLAHYREEQPAAEISWAQRATLMALVTRYLSTGDDSYLVPARALVDGLLRLAIRRPDGLCLPEGYYQPTGWGCREPDLYPGIEEYNGVIIGPALRLYRATGYAPALELAEGLARFALQHSSALLPDGGFRRLGADRPEIAHFHTHTAFALGVLALGITLGRREYIAWARQTYEHARTWGTEFGWFPEGLGLRHGEICCTTDMIELALLLGRHVDRRYYADAERYGRNHLLESQFLSLEALQTALARLPADESPAPHAGRYSTQERVAERQMGAFSSRPTLNDALHLDAPAMMQCCNAAGARALYDLWRYAVEEENGEPLQVRVHLRFSVETPALRVVSHEPAQGRLDVTARRACMLSVRLPEGEREAWALQGGRVRALSAQKGYVTWPAGAGETVTLHYTLRERSAHYEVGDPGRTAVALGHWRGETLMRVEPAGPFLPLYQGREDLPPVQPDLPAQALIESL